MLRWKEHRQRRCQRKHIQIHVSHELPGPAQYFGLEQIIEIGPMSGKSNILFWLDRRGMKAEDEVVERIYQRAKSSNRCLTEAEILECCATVAGG